MENITEKDVHAFLRNHNSLNEVEIILNIKFSVWGNKSARELIRDDNVTWQEIMGFFRKMYEK